MRLDSRRLLGSRDAERLQYSSYGIDPDDCQLTRTNRKSKGSKIGCKVLPQVSLKRQGQ